MALPTPQISPQSASTECSVEITLDSSGGDSSWWWKDWNVNAITGENWIFLRFEISATSYWPGGSQTFTFTESSNPYLANESGGTDGYGNTYNYIIVYFKHKTTDLIIRSNIDGSIILRSGRSGLSNRILRDS